MSEAVELDLFFFRADEGVLLFRLVDGAVLVAGESVCDGEDERDAFERDRVLIDMDEEEEEEVGVVEEEAAN